MELTNEQLKDIIANIDADVYIVQRQYATVDTYLRDMGYFIPMKDIKVAVNELTKDVYFVQLAKQLNII